MEKLDLTLFSCMSHHVVRNLYKFVSGCGKVNPTLNSGSAGGRDPHEQWPCGSQILGGACISVTI